MGMLFEAAQFPSLKDKIDLFQFLLGGRADGEALFGDVDDLEVFYEGLAIDGEEGWFEGLVHHSSN